ncbi:uncharacterized protein KZ484_007707 isoform 1-T1 [Pholidichthys leucotaenia]
MLCHVMGINCSSINYVRDPPHSLHTATPAFRTLEDSPHFYLKSNWFLAVGLALDSQSVNSLQTASCLLGQVRLISKSLDYFAAAFGISRMADGTAAMIRWTLFVCLFVLLNADLDTAATAQQMEGDVSSALKDVTAEDNGTYSYQVFTAEERVKPGTVGDSISVYEVISPSGKPEGNLLVCVLLLCSWQILH